ncbi:MAG: aldo/keto reductase [Thermoleophilia bacterium]
MLYRTLGRSGPEVSILGFGCMRLPVVDGRQDHIDTPAATAMLHEAIERGVNYVDTAYPYHGVSHTAPGMSEVFVGESLRGGYRDRVLLATKLPSWLVETRGDMDRFLHSQMERLQTDHIDCYLLHGLNAGTWQSLQYLGVLEFLDAALADGRIRYAGFSFHDEAAVFPPIVDAYDWTFCQIQYNYMDRAYQAGEAGLRYAVERGLGVIVMEPLRGGRLAQRIPPVVRAVWHRAEARRSPAAWALRFVWDHAGVSMLLSGMSDIDQVRENLATADEASPGLLTEPEHASIEEAAQAYRSRIVADCTECRYCLPCPSGVDIPRVIAHLNDASFYDDVKGIRELYHMRDFGRASACSECGECEELCPQGLAIQDLMKEAVRLFEE